MSLIKSGFPTSPRRSIWLNGVSQFGGGSVLFFDAQTGSITLDATDYGLYVNSSGNLIFWNGSSSTTLGGGGGGGTPTWETLFAADATFTVTPDTTFTIAGNRATATNVVTMTNVAGGSGAILAFTNATTSNNDVLGTGSTWAVTGAGGATFAGVTITGTSSALITSGAAVWTLLDNSATGLSVGASGNTTMMVFDTRNGAEIVNIGDGTTATGFAVGKGASTFASISNTVAAVAITNNTITTFGANANNAGLVTINSTSLTTGSALQINLSDTANVGGFYLTCRETVGGTNDFTIGENGVVTMLGTAASNSLTITNGHVVVTAGNLTLSDGVVAVTSTGTADVVSITADSLLANNALIVAGSGAFTGTTTSSFVAITPTGLSTGTALYIAAAAATTASVLADFTTSTTTGSVLRLTGTGVIVDGAASGVLTMVADSATTVGATDGRGAVSLSLDALTTGTGIDVTSTSITFTTGELLNVSHKSGNITGTLNCTSAGLVHVDATRTVTTGTVADDYDLGSFVRTDVINGAGSFSKAGSVLYVQNVTTNTSGTITDTVNGIEVVMDADGTGDAVKITHAATTGKSLNVVASATTGTVALITADSLTTSGVGLSIVNTAATMTSGSLLRVSSGTTAAVATNGIVSFSATGDFTSTSNAGFVSVLANSTTAGTIMGISGTALTTGVGLYVASTGTGLTTGSLIRATTGTTGEIATNGAISFNATGAFTTAVGSGFLMVNANSTTTGTVAVIKATSLTEGTILALSAVEATLTSGKYFQCFDGAAADFSIAKYGATVIAGNASGTAALTLTAGDLLVSSGTFSVSGLATLTSGIDGKVIFAGTETINAGGTTTALSLSKTVHYIDADAGGDIFTLADGTVGQIMTILLTSSTGVATITPANLAGGTSVTLNADGDSVVLQFMDTEWFILGGNSYAVI